MALAASARHPRLEHMGRMNISSSVRSTCWSVAEQAAEDGDLIEESDLVAVVREVGALEAPSTIIWPSKTLMNEVAWRVPITGVGLPLTVMLSIWSSINWSTVSWMLPSSR